jgi:peroxiredoxin
MLATKRAYDPKSKFYKLATKEYTSIIKQYEAYSYDLNQSPLFAAKFRQIVNLTTGIGTIITLDEKEKANNINSFITNELDFSILYTSNHWGGIINSWIQIHTQVLKDDAKLVADATTILNRIQSDAVYTDFVINLTKELTKAGKDDTLFTLIPIIKKSKRLLHYEGVLNVFKQDLSGKAPDLIIKNTNGSAILKTTELNLKYSLLLFYQSDCGHCETTIEALKKNYKDLVAKNIKIISIAGDTDQSTFEKSASTFPWSDKYRDTEGMKGVNFVNYGVIGTPTMYVINKEGSIVKKTASFSEVLDWITTH